MAQTLTFGRESPYILPKAIEPNQREDTGLWLQNRKAAGIYLKFIMRR
jgi:hypothetical protein